jgi:hypothetical protein
MRFEITYQDSYADCDRICAEEDEPFSVPSFDDVWRPCYGGEILDDNDNVIEDEIIIYRHVTYILREDNLYAVVGRRGKEIPWRDYDPDYGQDQD